MKQPVPPPNAFEEQPRREPVVWVNYALNLRGGWIAFLRGPAQVSARPKRKRGAG